MTTLLLIMALLSVTALAMAGHLLRRGPDRLLVPGLIGVSALYFVLIFLLLHHHAEVLS